MGIDVIKYEIGSSGDNRNNNNINNNYDSVNNVVQPVETDISVFDLKSNEHRKDSQYSYCFCRDGYNQSPMILCNGHSSWVHRD